MSSLQNTWDMPDPTYSPASQHMYLQGLAPKAMSSYLCELCVSPGLNCVKFCEAVACEALVDYLQLSILAKVFSKVVVLIK